MFSPRELSRCLCCTLAISAVLGCADTGQPTRPESNLAADAKVSTPPQPAAVVTPPEPVQDPLVGGPYPALLLSQAWFWKNAQGKPKPGPARLEIWRDTPDGWKRTRLEDPDSNVFHKALLYQGGILTIAAEQAMLKKWTFQGGAWQQELLWTRKWDGRFNRLRDIEVGDVDADGKDEFVIATHDYGVVAVYNTDEPGGAVVELDLKPDTFVHEIEIGDIDGDGKLEFFATPSARNKAGVSQEGGVVMYRWDGSTYQRTWVEHFTTTHAKEILVTDTDQDGTDELYVALEAQLDDQKQIVKPVEIRRYLPDGKGGFTSSTVATLSDQQNRFLLAGDFDGDGQVELVAAAMRTGVWILERDPDNPEGQWNATCIDDNSSGFEHVAFGADLDGKPGLELYVAADDQRELKRYTYNKESGAYQREVLAHLADDTFTWNMEAGLL